MKEHAGSSEMNYTEPNRWKYEFLACGNARKPEEATISVSVYATGVRGQRLHESISPNYST